MADIVLEQGEQIPGTMQTRYVDMGDGTHAQAVSADIIAIAGGEYATPTHTTATVTIVTGVALAANASRIYAAFINDSDTPIYLKFGAAAVANEGIRLNAAGGSYEMSALAGNLYTGAINAIHGGAGNKILLVLEGV